MSGFGKYVDDLPPWAKGVVTILLLAGTAAVSYAVYKNVKANRDKAGAEKEKKASEKELDAMKNKGERISFPESAYEGAANEIANKLDGCETLGSELEVIQQVIRVVKRPIDWLQLAKAFGVRKIDNCGLGTGDTNYTLPALLKDQLDTGGAFTNEIIDGSGKPKTGFTDSSFKILLAYLNSIHVTI